MGNLGGGFVVGEGLFSPASRPEAGPLDNVFRYRKPLGVSMELSDAVGDGPVSFRLSQEAFHLFFP